MTYFVLQPKRWWHMPKYSGIGFFFSASLQTSPFLLWKLSVKLKKKTQTLPFGAFIMHQRKRQGQKSCLVLSNTCRRIQVKTVNVKADAKNQQSPFTQRSSSHTNLDILRIWFSRQHIFSVSVWNGVLKENSRLKNCSSAMISRNLYSQYFQILLSLKKKLNGLVEDECLNSVCRKPVYLRSSYINCVMWNCSDRVFLRVAVQFSSATLSAALATNAL